MMKDKIIHILYSGLGGHSSVFFTLAANKVNSETEYIPFFCGIEDINPGNITQCQKYGLRYKGFIKKKGFDYQIYKKIYNALKHEKPQSIFLHGASFLIPVIFYKIANPTVKIYSRDTEPANLKTTQYWILLLLSYLISNKTIFLTPEAKQSFTSKLWFFKGKRAVIIPNGVNIEVYMPQKKTRAENKIVIGMQSRLQPTKDHITLIKAFHKLMKDLPEFNLELQVAGGGDTREVIENVIASLQVDNMVKLLGNLKEGELVEFMSNLDIYVHATLGETLSNSILQAMSSQLPIIASNVWGVNNLIDDGINGLLYNSQDQNDLTAKLVLLIKSPEYAQALGEAAREKIELSYSAKLAATRYENMFKGL